MVGHRQKVTERNLRVCVLEANRLIFIQYREARVLCLNFQEGLVMWLPLAQL